MPSIDKTCFATFVADKGKELVLDKTRLNCIRCFIFVTGPLHIFLFIFLNTATYISAEECHDCLGNGHYYRLNNTVEQESVRKGSAMVNS